MRGGLVADQQTSNQNSVTRIRDYQLLEVLGQGGMGAVYRAEHTRLKRTVALKVLARGRTSDPQAVARFEREMEAVGRLDDPRIVRALDAGEYDGIHYLVMEYVDGIDLAVLARQMGRLAIADACEVTRQAALGLQRVYEAGLVHRDLKPSNLMLTRSGRIKILDLGLALLRGESSDREMTEAGQAIGTVDYMAPEQVTDSHSVDIRADVYSLGCTLYRLLTGRAPFAADGPRPMPEAIMAHVRDPVPPIESHRPEVPEGLATIICRMLAKSPADRFATPVELADALRPFAADSDLVSLVRTSQSSVSEERPDHLISTVDLLSSAIEGTPAHRSAHPGRGPRPWRRWTGWLAGIALLAVTAAIAGYIIAVSRPGPNEQTASRDTEPAPSPAEVPAAAPPVAPSGQDPSEGLAPYRETVVETDGPWRRETTTLFQERVAEEFLAQEQLVFQAADEPEPMAVAEPDSAIVAKLVGHTGPVCCLAFSADGRRLATGGEDQTLRVWDTKTWTHVATLRGQTTTIQATALSPDGNMLAWAGTGGVSQRLFLWDLQSGQERRSLSWEEPTRPSRVYSVVFSSNGQRLAAAGDGPVRVWDLRDAEKEPLVLKWQALYPSYVHCVAFSPEGKLLAAGCHGGSPGSPFGDCVRLWNAETGEPGDLLVEKSTPYGSLTHESIHGAVVFSPDGSLLLRATAGGPRYKFRSPIGRLKIWSLDEHGPSDLTSHLVPGGNTFAVWVKSSDQIVVAAAMGYTESAGGFGSATAGAFTPNDFFGSSSPAGNAASETEDDSSESSSPFGPSVVGLWNAADEECGCFDSEHRGSILAVAISPDGRHLVTASDDNTARVWEIARLELLPPATSD